VEFVKLSCLLFFFFDCFFPQIRPEALQVDQKSTCNEIAGRQIIAGGIKLDLPQVGFFSKKKELKNLKISRLGIWP